MKLIHLLITLFIACAVSLTSQAVEEKSANTAQQSAQEVVVQPVVSNAKQSAEVTAKAPTGLVVNINTASATELESLPGVGPKTAEQILAYRQEHGRFASIEQLREVPGIGDKKLGAVKDMVSIE